MSSVSQTETSHPVSIRAIREALDPGFLDKYEPLSREQVGHLRHFHNLASQRDGYWGLMGSQDPGQEWIDAYRYQLAVMAYAAGAAHYHRLPALRSVFKDLLQALIAKMMKRDVWGYWFLTSHSGKVIDPDLEELRKPWADPIVRENIMYSGHLLLMVSLYTMLFNDDRYNQEGALTFNWNPIFWGMGPESFSYTRQSLQNAILAEMEREKWLGVCCEPNSIFIVCNQFPIIAFRYNDIHDNKNIAEEVITKYTEAWKAKGMYQSDGLMIEWYSPRQDTKTPTDDIGGTAWACAFMNAWNPLVASQSFQSQATGFLTQVEDDRVNLNRSDVASAIRKLVQEENVDPHSQETIQAAIEAARRQLPPPSEGPEVDYPSPTFGYVLQWVSEVGTERVLTGLLNHADRFLNPTWENGGLYYAPSDETTDEQGNWKTMDPFTGNAAVGYARLNIADGQRKMWLEPWTPQHVSRTPYIDGINLASGVDLLRGVWDEERRAMILTFRTWDSGVKEIRPSYHNLPVGEYHEYRDGQLVGTRSVNAERDIINIALLVAGEESTVVLLHV